MSITYRRSGPEDLPELRSFWEERWGDDFVIAHGVLYRPDDMEGFIALENGRWVGVITYTFRETECEIVSVDSLREGQGIGTSLIEKAAAEARRAGCSRLCLITTNDNLRALGFYQKRGFKLVRVNREAVNKSRKIKPSIPLIGEQGIPIRDEIELEMTLNP